MPAPPSLPHVERGRRRRGRRRVGPRVDDIGIGDEVVIDPSTSCGRCPACVRGEVPFCPDFRIVGEHRWGTHADAVVVPAVNVRSKPPSLSWEQAAASGLVDVVGAAHAAARTVRAGRRRARRRASAAAARSPRSCSRSALGAAPRLGDVARGHQARLGRRPGRGRRFYSDGRLRRGRSATATEGRGVDLVIDNVGTATFERSLRSLARGGRLVTNGSTSGRTAELHLPTLFWRQLEVIGSTMNDHREFADAMQLVGSGAVEIPIDATFRSRSSRRRSRGSTPATSSARSCSRAERPGTDRRVPRVRMRCHTQGPLRHAGRCMIARPARRDRREVTVPDERTDAQLLIASRTEPEPSASCTGAMPRTAALLRPAHARPGGRGRADGRDVRGGVRLEGDLSGPGGERRGMALRHREAPARSVLPHRPRRRRRPTEARHAGA